MAGRTKLVISTMGELSIVGTIDGKTHTHTHTYIYIYIYIHTHTHTQIDR